MCRHERPLARHRGDEPAWSGPLRQAMRRNSCNLRRPGSFPQGTGKNDKTGSRAAIACVSATRWGAREWAATPDKTERGRLVAVGLRPLPQMGMPDRARRAQMQRREFTTVLAAAAGDTRLPVRSGLRGSRHIVHFASPPSCSTAQRRHLSPGFDPTGCPTARQLPRPIDTYLAGLSLDWSPVPFRAALRNPHQCPSASIMRDLLDPLRRGRIR
jgi:hypothetical protein